VDQETRDVHDAIASDRADLADTVEALAQKADVKGRVRDTLTKGAEQLQQKAGEVRETVRNVTPDQAESQAAAVARRVQDRVQERPMPFAVAGAFLGGLLVGRRMGRRR
jgi:ElaB/YqjD/DUF883 family membrane-anchored ribosome-binding protein